MKNVTIAKEENFPQERRSGWKRDTTSEMEGEMKRQKDTENNKWIELFFWSTFILNIYIYNRDMKLYITKSTIECSSRRNCIPVTCFRFDSIRYDIFKVLSFFNLKLVINLLQVPLNICFFFIIFFTISV